MRDAERWTQKREANTKFGTTVVGSPPLRPRIYRVYIVALLMRSSPFFFLLFSIISDYRALSSPHVVYVELPKIAG